MWENIVNGNALNNPNLLNEFFVISFADLKTYKFYYWFAFPALSFDKPIQLETSKSIKHYFTQQQFIDLQIQYNKLSSPSFFVVHNNNILLLNQFDFKNLNESTYFGYVESSTYEQPGWPLRNYLMLLAKYINNNNNNNNDSIKILSFRETDFNNINSDDDVNNNKRYENSSSIIYSIKYPESKKEIRFEGEESKTMKGIKSVGWEMDKKGKLQPKLIDLQSTMNPINLADTSANLNLQLMKWRLLPSLDLDLLNNTKCLLIGAGTLGCNVARSLMSWGVRNITFIDNGIISYSNPVRQSLYHFNDCLSIVNNNNNNNNNDNNNESKDNKDNVKWKAKIAAEELKRILPTMNSRGEVMSIPMPGHTVTNDEIEDVKQNIEKLNKLIEEHDVIYLLTDSRESRWLPTLLSSIHNKLVLNTALGFDTYLVMRHGVNIHCNNNNNNNNEIKLGCYFCNDVVAPQNVSNTNKEM